MDGLFHHNLVDTRIRLTNDDKTFEKIQTPFHNTNQAKEQGIANDSYEVHQIKGRKIYKSTTVLVSFKLSASLAESV